MRGMVWCRVLPGDAVASGHGGKGRRTRYEWKTAIYAGEQ